MTEQLKSDFGIEMQGFSCPKKVYWNLSAPALYEESILRNESLLGNHGPLIVNTGKHTGRSAKDKFLVREATSEKRIWWGETNRSFDTVNFDILHSRMLDYFKNRDIFVQDCFGGSDPGYRIPIRIITEYAWHSLFARTMFIKPEKQDGYKKHIPEFTIISAPQFHAFPETEGTRSSTFIILNFEKKLVIIGGTAYGGEIKKSVFTILNYLLPLKGILTMHCSANKGQNDDVALFFGLSGTGKTTLSADPDRGLIGDDEHGWSDDGIFNFEDGCYAKVIRLSPVAEPQIYACTRKFGTIIENVVYDPVTRVLDLDSDRITENTRAAYPLDYIENSIPEKRAGHPRNIVMLTCDASGVMPPISRLNPDQALYHFISGYTAKVSGTEVGMGSEPQITFSACFGAPFMVHHPAFYASMLKKKILGHKVNCWLVNTGWSGGPYGIGKRISIQWTRSLLNAALNGKLNSVEYYKDPVFGFEVPCVCEGVPSQILNPSNSWKDKDDYMNKYRQMASLFIENFRKFEQGCSPEVIEAGPKITRQS
jgi:phosphoenolpyruvate carboxykinase (ATP)